MFNEGMESLVLVLGLGMCQGGKCSDGVFGVWLRVAWLRVVLSTHEASCFIEDTSITYTLDSEPFDVDLARRMLVIDLF